MECNFINVSSLDEISFAQYHLFKGIVSLYKGRVLLFLKTFESTAKRDEYGCHTRASTSGIDHAISRAHSQPSIDRSQCAYDGR